MGATCGACTCTTQEQQTEYQVGIVSLFSEAQQHTLFALPKNATHFRLPLVSYSFWFYSHVIEVVHFGTRRTRKFERERSHLDLLFSEHAHVLPPQAADLMSLHKKLAANFS